MKYLYVGLLILVLLVFACLTSSGAVRRGAEDLIHPLTQAESACRRGDTLAMTLQLDRAEELWEKNAGLFTVLLSHTYTTQVDNDIRELPALEQDEFLLRCRGLIRLLRQLQDMDLPRPGNIF